LKKQTPHIAYLPHQLIDKRRWDACIHQSGNGEVYALSLYLDQLCHWDALVLGDYEAVMPLPFRKKMGIHYIYPPAFTQQLGIISIQPVSAEIQQSFFDAIPARFRYIEMNLHHSNEKPGIGKLTERKNYLLDLSTSYELLHENFSRSCKRNLRKADEQGISIIDDISSSVIIDMHRSRFKDAIGSEKKDYDAFEILCQLLKKENKTYIIGAKNNQGNIIAGSIYVVFKNKLYFVLNGNMPESLENGATHLLMDHTIRAFAGKNMQLDFEGSDTPSFARFYEQYGATPENYYQVRINRLPWPFSLFKK